MYVEGDVPYVGTTNGNANSGFFGGDGWWAIILFAMIFGWGNNGWGNNGRNSGGVTDGYILASDFSNIERKIDGVNSGICDGFRSIRDEITANRIEDKNAQIAAQQNEINALRLKASQEAQNAYLVNQLKPCPIPAYITCNPYQTYTGACGTGTCGSVI